MEEVLFYKNLHQHFKSQLPFVVYRKPLSTKVVGFLQKDDTINFIIDFTEKGFVFAPFDSEDKTILIPYNQSDVIDYSISGNSKKPSFESGNKFQNPQIVKEKSEHIKLVEETIEKIKFGVFQKVVISRKEEVDLQSQNPITVFQRLIQTYPTAFVYCWYHPKIGLWSGATPETLLKIEDSRLTTMALAGTRYDDPDGDFVWGDKEIKEQELVTNTIVKGLRNKSLDLDISETYTHKAGTLLHLRTDITAQLTAFSGDTLKSLLKVLHPTPAVCGLPKEEAKHFVLENEFYNRAYYTGYLGEQNIEDGSTNLFVNLRCMQFKKNKVILYVGGGITKDSHPESEWEETVKKTETMKKVL